MTHRVTAAGIESWRTLTPWSGIKSITLVMEPDVTHNGQIIAQRSGRIIIDLVTGDVLEIPDGSPSWDAFVEDLPRHRALLVRDLAEAIAAGEPSETLLWDQSTSEPCAYELAQQILARGLPDAVVTIATRGGAILHPALWYRAESVEPFPAGPAWAVVAESGRNDLVPLWTCGTVSVFSAAEGSFLEWDAEQDEPQTVWPDFASVVRSLLTDLWEDEVEDAQLIELARLLLPKGQIDAALVPEDR